MHCWLQTRVSTPIPLLACRVPDFRLFPDSRMLWESYRESRRPGAHTRGHTHGAQVGRPDQGPTACCRPQESLAQSLPQRPSNQTQERPTVKCLCKDVHIDSIGDGSKLGQVQISTGRWMERHSMQCGAQHSCKNTADRRTYTAGQKHGSG